MTRRERTPRQRWARRAVVAATLLLLYTLAGFFAVPWAMQRYGVAALNDRLRGDATLQRAAFNPFTFAWRLDGLEVRDDQSRTAASFARFAGDFDPFASLFNWSWRFRSLAIDEPFLLAEVSPEGSLNLARLLKPAAKPSRPLEAIPHVVVRSFAVNGGRVLLRDLSTPELFERELDGIDVALGGLDTHPSSDNPHTLVATTADAEKLEWTGSFRADPLTSTGALTLSSIDLTRFMPYALRYLDGRVAGGVLDATITYDFAPAASPRIARAVVTQAHVADVHLERAGDDLAIVPLVTVTNAALDADARTLAIESISLDRAIIHARRDADGTLPALKLIRRAQRDAAAAEAAAPPGEDIDVAAIPYPLERLLAGISSLTRNARKPWTISLEKAAVTAAETSFTDIAARAPVNLAFRVNTLTAGPIRSSDGFRTQLTLDGDFESTGRVHLEATLDPPATRVLLEIRAGDLPLAAAAPYLPEKLHDPIPPAKLTSLAASLDGALVLAVLDDAMTLVEWDGAVTLTNAQLHDASSGAPLLIADRAHAQGQATAELRAGGPGFAYSGRVELEGLDLDAPLAGPVRAALEAASWTGEANAALASTATLTLRGDADAAGLSIAAPERNNLDLRIESLAARAFAFDSAAPAASADEITVAAPAIAASLPLASAPRAPERTAPPDRSIRLPFALAVHRFAVERGSLRIRDDAATPPAEIVASDLDIDIAAIDNSGAGPASFDLTARVQESSTLRAQGKIDPFRARPEADIRVEIAALPLKPYDAFSGRFVGYTVESGRLTLVFPVTVTEGKVAGQLDVVLDRFYLADKVKSDQAPNIPVKLGLDLLRDSKEQIKAKIPIKGNLDDPKFTLGGVILEAFFGLIGKAATAPFSILGSILGLEEGADLSSVAFEPGADTLTPEAASTLDALARALAERPAIRLAIAGRASPAIDVPALRAADLRASLAARVRKPSLTPEEYATQLKLAWTDAFPVEARAARVEERQPTIEEMEPPMLARIDVPSGRLLDLAKRRADAVLRALTQEAGADPARIRILEPDDKSAAAEKPTAEFTIDQT